MNTTSSTTLSTDSRQADIRGVAIAVTGGRLLLPNATIAEVITYSDPEPVPGAPGWLLGRIRWRGWKLPIVSFARMAGFSEVEGERGSKVAVLKALSGNPRLPYFAMLTQGFPRLTTVSAEALLIDAEAGESLPEGVLSQVTLRDEPASIPDLGRIEQLIADALQQAA
jgi:chemosensory pili system protein ChpC